MVKNEWGVSTYPLVPGHEIAGIVTEVGSKVDKFKVGDRVGVGCLVDSCRTSQNCEESLENYCPRSTLTYGAKHGDGTITHGGYSDSMVADEHFVIHGIIDTVSANHRIVPLIGLPKSHGKLVMVGAPDKPLELPVFPLLQGRKLVAGSAIGGLKETQEMIDFSAKHNIKPEIEVIDMDYVNTAIERLLKADVKYQFVIEIGNSLKPTS
ncbi:hypothetical protein KIW84_022577 [Lathyrus oleraceus]|uniref:Alcohol dehydrogenase-like N-terminal domain-containing protein n=1 Tax=Pisum sativum TaxID=3888 RepID=A0A9D4YF91_PEA|nr:hypothetical protein KIW84_022577 [Pisum sativum]